jgi:hypothetical protein
MRFADGTHRQRGSGDAGGAMGALDHARAHQIYGLPESQDADDGIGVAEVVGDGDRVGDVGPGTEILPDYPRAGAARTATATARPATVGMVATDWTLSSGPTGAIGGFVLGQR